MSTATFPNLIGQGWSVTRSEIWKTRLQTAVSGKETRIGDWAYPRHMWDLTFEFLREGSFAGASYTEFQQLAAFFDLRTGAFDSFLYQDNDDYTITGQLIGQGDGGTTVFPLVRSFGGFIEPILAPNLGATLNVYVNSVLKSPSFYSVTPWDTSNSNGPGQVIFSTAPGNGLAIAVDFSWYFPCRFGTATQPGDQMDFEKFMQGLYLQKKMQFTSIK